MFIDILWLSSKMFPGNIAKFVGDVMINPRLGTNKNTENHTPTVCVVVSVFICNSLGFIIMKINHKFSCVFVCFFLYFFTKLGHCKFVWLSCFLLRVLESRNVKPTSPSSSIRGQSNVPYIGTSQFVKQTVWAPDIFVNVCWYWSLRSVVMKPLRPGVAT